MMGLHVTITLLDSIFNTSVYCITIWKLDSYKKIDIMARNNNFECNKYFSGDR